MHEEAGFLSVIRSTPNDETARLAYLDWLEEQDDPSAKQKAAFIRLETQLLTTAPEPSNVLLSNYLRPRAEALNPMWLTVMSRPPIEGRWDYREEPPSGRWGVLRATLHNDARICRATGRVVYYCKTLDEAQNRTTKGEWVVVSFAAARCAWDLYSGPSLPSALSDAEYVHRMARVPGVGYAPPELIEQRWGGRQRRGAVDTIPLRERGREVYRKRQEQRRATDPTENAE